MEDRGPPGPIAGRQREMAQIREVAGGRGRSARSLVVSADLGSGKTTTIREALDDFDGDVFWYNGGQLSAGGPWAVPVDARTLVATDAGLELSAAGAPAASIGHATTSSSSPVELGQRLVAALVELPPRDTSAVVVVDDLDQSDTESSALVAHLARRNDLFGVPYIISCRYPPPTTLDGLEFLHLSGLDAGDARECLLHWRSVEVPAQVGAVLANLSNGNPMILKELAESLTVEQLVGDAAMPLQLRVTPVAERIVASLTIGLSAAELTGLACFADAELVPAQVVQNVCGDAVVASLVAKDLIVEETASCFLKNRVVGAVAARRLGYQERRRLHRQLAAAWEPISAVRSALYGCLSRDRVAETLANARTALADRSEVADSALFESLASTVVDVAGPEATVADWINLIEASEHARHLHSAIRSFDRASKISGPPRENDLRHLTRWRGVLSQITHDWSLAIPSPGELSALTEIRPSSAFEVLTRTARNTMLIGSTHRARGYLDRAQQFSRSASNQDRSLWRLVDCQWKNATGEGVRAATLREAVTRWCYDSDRTDWYDDVLGMRALIDAEAYEEARQFLINVESSYRNAAGYSAIFVPMVRLRYEVATFQVPDALATLATFRSVSRGSLVHLKELGADLIRLEAIAGLEPGELGYDHARACVADRLALAAASGYRSLVDGDFRNAAGQLELVLRETASLTINQRWQVLADLVEAQVALGNAPAAEVAVRVHRPGQPDSPHGTVAHARCRALLAPPIDVRSAFAEALSTAGHPLAQVHYGRAQLAYARRLGQLGLHAQSEEQRTDAETVFRHQGLLGWAQHAQRITNDRVTEPVHLSLVHERLDATELRIMRLLLAGKKNSEVAAELFVSLRTVEKNLTRMYRKLDVPNRAEMLALIRDDDPFGEVG